MKLHRLALLGIVVYAIIFSCVVLYDTETLSNLLFDATEWEVEKFVESNKVDSTSEQPLTNRRFRSFFPEYGTPEFSEACRWSLEPPQQQNVSCTFLARPIPNVTEGISRWTQQVIMTFILGKQAGCDILLDYGDGVDIKEVLSPFPNLHDSFNNWTVPEGFECLKEKNCLLIDTSIQIIIVLQYMEPLLGKRLVSAPNYRYAYVQEYNRIDPDHQLKDVLPGYQVESGFACALGNLFHLAPSAAQFEPRLFTSILPSLHDERALVMTLYIRTMYSENRAKEDSSSLESAYTKSVVQCALELEKQMLSTEEGTNNSRVVWMLVTDSPRLKDAVVTAYHGENVNMTGLQRKGPILREVLVTRSRGVHTKKFNHWTNELKKPSTADFAEALIDWFLIGESDVVIQNEWTFALTGALRTNRTVYDSHTCRRKSMIKQKTKK